MKEDNNEKINKKINIFIIIINIIFIYCINYLVVIILNIQNNCFNIFFFFFDSYLIINSIELSQYYTINLSWILTTREIFKGLIKFS